MPALAGGELTTPNANGTRNKRTKGQKGTKVFFYFNDRPYERGDCHTDRLRKNIKTEMRPEYNESTGWGLKGEKIGSHFRKHIGIFRYKIIKMHFFRIFFLKKFVSSKKGRNFATLSAITGA